MFSLSHSFDSSHRSCAQDKPIVTKLIAKAKMEGKMDSLETSAKEGLKASGGGTKAEVELDMDWELELEDAALAAEGAKIVSEVPVEERDMSYGGDDLDVEGFSFGSESDESDAKVQPVEKSEPELAKAFDVKVLQTAIEASTKALDLVVGKDVVMVAGKTGKFVALILCASFHCFMLPYHLTYCLCALSQVQAKVCSSRGLLVRGFMKSNTRRPSPAKWSLRRHMTPRTHCLSLKWVTLWCPRRPRSMLFFVTKLSIWILPVWKTQAALRWTLQHLVSSRKLLRGARVSGSSSSFIVHLFWRIVEGLFVLS